MMDTNHIAELTDQELELVDGGNVVAAIGVIAFVVGAAFGYGAGVVRCTDGYGETALSDLALY